MCRTVHTFFRCFFALLLVLAPCARARSAKHKAAPTPAIRWEEGKPGCTFSRDDDGRYRYGLWADDVGIILAVDSQELQRVHRRIHPIFGLLLTVRYRGTDKLDVSLQGLKLEFVKHSHVVKSNLHPDEFAKQVQDQADEMAHQTERQIRKHPDEKNKKEEFLRAYEKDVTELLQFLSSRSLRPATLDAIHREVSGWIFFSTKDKWIGDWKKKEDFVLRFPIQNRFFEFPFTLPPEEGDLILRRRPD